VASSLTRRLAELEARAAAAELKSRKQQGTIVALQTALKDKDK
jgi:hypothetical protein